MNNKSKVLIVFLIIIIILLSGVLCFKIMENKDKEDVKTEEKITKIEPKENYNGTLLYSETTGLDKYVRDDKFNEVKKEIPTIEDILDDYLSFKHLPTLVYENYNINVEKMTNFEKLLYYNGPTGTIKCSAKNEDGEIIDNDSECLTYKEENVNTYLSDSVFGDRISKIDEKSDKYFTYDDKNKMFIADVPTGLGALVGEYIRIIDLNKKENNYILKIKIGTLCMMNDYYHICGIKSEYNETTGEYKNSTKLDEKYTIEDESLLDILEIELKPYNNSYKYVISNITIK